jgi:hypothetical protein
MARAPSKRVMLNRAALGEVALIVADGLLEAGRTIIEVAAENAPDSPYDPYPTGEGLPKQGGVLVYAGSQKTAGWSQRGNQPAKPRAVRGTAKEHSVVAVIGFGFPARFAERGTINHPGKPFLTPARDRVAPHIPDIVGQVTRPRLGGR